MSGLVLDGVAIFDSAEQSSLFEGYFEPLVVDARGGHFARTWTRIRDMFIWFPWTCHDPERLNGTDLPPPASSHRWTSMFFQAAPHYAETYRAAIEYGEKAVFAAAHQSRPAVYLAHEHDMLAPHLERLPPLKPEDRIERCSSQPGVWLERIRRTLGSLAQTNNVSTGSLNLDHAGVDLDGDVFIELPHGQLRLRCYGDRSRARVLLLHDAPATGLALRELAQSLGDEVCVWVPDLPGYGSSEPLAQSADLSDFAVALAPLIQQAARGPLTLYGRGCGAMLALLLATRHPGSVRQLVLDELPLSGGAIAPLDSRICPQLTLEPDGSHWYRTWQMLRDSQIFWPWYESRSSNLLRLPGRFSADFLHEWTVQVLQQPHSAHCLPHACLNVDPGRWLRQLSIPVTLMARRGHPLESLGSQFVSLIDRCEFVTINDANRASALRQRILTDGPARVV